MNINNFLLPFILISTTLAGCLDSPSDSLNHNDFSIFCVLSEVEIHEFGEATIERQAVNRAITVIAPLFQEITVSYHKQPATASFEDFLAQIEQGDLRNAVLAISISDQVPPENPDAPEPFGFAGGGSIVLFPDQWRPWTKVGPVSVQREPPIEPTESWAAFELELLLHEIGHVLGLVNNGIPMQTPREDPDRPRHSTDPNSPMDSGSPRPQTFLPDERLTDYSQEDWADLWAAREPGAICNP